MADLIEIGINVRSNAEAASRGLDRLEGSVVKNLRTAERLEKEYKRLDRAFNQNKISAQTYARGVQQVDRAIEGLWKETDRATQATQRLNAATNRSAVVQNQFGEVASRNTQRFKRFGSVGLQQVGYQVQDFAVQVQGGTSAFVALGQQGSQLLGIFGAKGALLGAFLAIGTAILNVKDQTGSLSFAFQKFMADVKPALEPLVPLWDLIKKAVSLAGNVIVEGVNLMINAFLGLSTIVGALPDAFNAGFNFVRQYARAFVLDIQATTFEVKALWQDMMDFITPGAAAGGALNETLSQDFREFAENYRSQADGLRKSADEAGGAVQVLSESLSNMTKIDIRDYFGKGAKAAEDLGKAGGKAGKEIEDTAKKAKTALEEAYITTEEFAELWKNQVVDGIESVSGAFTDFIMSGFRNFEDFADAIKATFRNLIATLIQTAIQNQIVIPIVASVTGGGGGLGGLLGGGGGGGGGLLGNLPGGGGGLLGTIGGGIATLGSNLVTGGSAVAGGFLQGLGGVVGQGFGGLGASFGSLGGIVSGSVGIGGGSMASAIGAALPAVGVIAAGIGLISKAFEKQTESWEVIVGNISKLDAKIEKFGMIKSYNMFSSDVDYYTAPVEEGVFASFLQGVRQVQQGAMDAAATLGISADAFNNFVFQIDPYAKSLTDEIVRMGDAFAALVPGVSNLNELLAVANERYNLNTRLLQLQGNEEELIRRQREQELAVVHPLNRATLERIYALEDELRQQQQMQQKLQEIDQLGQRNLQDAERAVRDAFNALRESIRRVVDDLRIKLRAANDTLQNSQRLFDLLSGYSSSRRIEGAQLSEPRFARARSSALGFLRRGDLSDEQRLEEALQIVSEPSENLFGSFVDYARDFYRTSNVISDLEKTAGVQLSADEQAVQKLEDQIAQAEAQMDIMQEQWNTLQGIEAGILSIPEAIANLKEAFGAFQEAQASTGPAPNTSSYSEETYSGFNREQRYLANNLDVLRAIQRGEFASATEHYLLHGQYEGRAFAQGGFHTGGVRMVGEQGPELEMTGPSRIFSHRQTADMFRDPELTNEVRSLRSEVAGLRTENAQLLANNNKYTKRSYDLYRKWDVDGQPPERT